MVEARDTAGSVHRISYMSDHNNGRVPHLCERPESEQGMELDYNVGWNYVFGGPWV